MYQIHGIGFAANTTKILYVAEALGLEYEFIDVDLSTGAHKTPEHLKRHPLGKLPTLTHDDKTLFESNAICSYLANVEGSALYPSGDHYQCALVEQWLAFFTNHVGRWLTSYFFETVIREKLGLGDKDEKAVAEALGFLVQQLPALEERLQVSAFLTGEQKTIADYVAYAYLESTDDSGYSLSDYPTLKKWYQAFKSDPAILAAQKKLAA
ncbi:MAG: glutathione S-transferase [Alteromonadaceae bacterium]|nr:MAG: glutathione S-transferase [Alteromonadaceae bacterium]